MNAAYAANVSFFVNENPNAIVASLCNASQSVLSRSEPTQYSEQWKEKIAILQESLGQLKACSGWSEWHVVLEYPIPWTVRHMDAILLAHGMVFAIELRVGVGEYSHDDVALVEDFCIQLRDFHAACLNHRIIPILMSAQAPSTTAHHSLRDDVVQQVFLSNRDRLTQLIGYIAESYYTPGAQDIQPDAWEKESLKASPHLTDVAQALFAGEHTNRRDLRVLDEGYLPVENELTRIIDQAKTNSEKVVCFIHGVPGSGKTLTSLSLAGMQDEAVFLSGNAALIDVLQQGILDGQHRDQTSEPIEHRQQTLGFVQELYSFFDQHYGNDILPEKHVVFVDDAHRSRGAKLFPKKYIRQRTEAGMLLDIMTRHNDWAVIIAVIGDGCLISLGEAGLPDWRRALSDDFSFWKVEAPPRLLARGEDENDEQLFDSIPQHVNLTVTDALQLNTCLRPPRTSELSGFVNALLGLSPDDAKEILQGRMTAYPIVYTRKLSKARQWLTDHQSGLKRCGLIVSTGAKRLKACGLEIADRLNVDSWLMRSPNDVRSCCKLELAARDWHVQGLELDWSCVCWGADLRHDSAGWQYARFHGSSWLLEDERDPQDVIRNRYRVLLTRARDGLVIWIPEGDPDDQTRQPEFYNQTARYFEDCGIPCIDEPPATEA